VDGKGRSSENSGEEVLKEVLEGGSGRLGDGGKESGRRRREGVLSAKSEGATLQHTRGEGAHERVGLEMEVAEHSIGAPAADHFDEVGVDAGAEEGHGTTGAKSPSVNIGGGEAVDGEGEGGRDPKGSGDNCGSDVGRGVGAEDAVEWCYGRGPVSAKVFNSANEGVNWAGDGVSTASVSELFSTNHILLGREGKFGKSRAVKERERAREVVQDAVAKAKFNITEVERRGFGRFAIFPRAEQVEKGDVG
jgi:hypothetical protein